MVVEAMVEMVQTAQVESMVATEAKGAATLRSSPSRLWHLNYRTQGPHN